MGIFNFKTKVTVVGGNRTLERVVSAGILKILTSKSTSINTSVKEAILPVVTSAIYESNTVLSLLYGKLKNDFGLTEQEASSVAADIVTYLVGNFDVSIVKGLRTEVSLKFLPVDPSIISRLPEGSFQSSSGHPVNWLEWLMTRGTEVIIGDYWLFTNASGQTRSGGSSIMVKIGTKPRDPFRVDPEHAGTVDDNFVTQALAIAYPKILEIASNEILKALS